MEDILAHGLRLFLLLFFALAVWQKLRQPLRFEDVLRAYALLPETWVPTVLWLVILAEGLAAALLLTLWWPVGMGLAAALLAISALAMGVNLLRGRRNDCGCGSLDESQPLTPMYPLRNLALAALAQQLARDAGGAPPASWVVAVLVALGLLIAWQITTQFALED